MVFLVVIDDLYLVGVSVMPNKADTPLVINADAVGPGPIAFKGFKPVSRGALD